MTDANLPLSASSATPGVEWRREPHGEMMRTMGTDLDYAAIIAQLAAAEEPNARLKEMIARRDEVSGRTDSDGRRLVEYHAETRAELDAVRKAIREHGAKYAGRPWHHRPDPPPTTPEETEEFESLMATFSAITSPAIDDPAYRIPADERARAQAAVNRAEEIVAAAEERRRQN